MLAVPEMFREKIEPLGIEFARVRPDQKVVFFEDWPAAAGIIEEHAQVPVVLINAGHGEYKSGSTEGAR